MANWSLPVTSTLYTSILSNLSDRLNDVATLFSSAPSNQPDGTKRWNGATSIFESYSTSTSLWTALVLAVAGGGTGATDAAGIRAAAGLGSLATQNSNALSVTGGSLSGITSLGLSGLLSSTGKIQTTSSAADAIKAAGGITAGAGAVAIINTDGKIPAISSTYFASLSGANLTSIPAAAIAAGTAGINISGNAATATTASGGWPAIPTKTSQITNDSGFIAPTDIAEGSNADGPVVINAAGTVLYKRTGMYDVNIPGGANNYYINEIVVEKGIVKSIILTQV